MYVEDGEEVILKQQVKAAGARVTLYDTKPMFKRQRFHCDVESSSLELPIEMYFDAAGDRDAFATMMQSMGAILGTQQEA